VVAPPDDVDEKLTYGDIFENEINTHARSVKVVDALAEMISAAEKESVCKISTSDPFPSNWGRQLVLTSKEASEELKLQVFVIWDFYRGKAEAHLLSGSYNFGTGQFAGSQTGPPIDTRGSHPGPGWELLTQRPSKTSCRTVVGILRSSLHGTRAALIDQLAARAIR
jgi:hypothetical protein